MVADYNDNYNHGPEVEYTERKRRKSKRQQRKLIIIIIILAILAAAFAIGIFSLMPHGSEEKENLSWYYQMQQEAINKQQQAASTESRVYDLSNSSAEMTPVITRLNNRSVTMFYDNNISFSYSPSFSNSYYLKLSNINPSTKIALEYYVPDISFNRSVLDEYITKKADDGVYIKVGEIYREIESVYPDPQAMMKIIITDENGSEILTDGYNVGSDSSKKQTILLYSGGNFNIELKGSKIDLNLKIYQSVI
ncbi:MAG: hypothetical protein Q4Q53_00790 [Methanocorpusculum sp.]|nr:hypothetical protein [Methanocorpusculum sp.]